jgi:hypothetical protein
VKPSALAVLRLIAKSNLVVHNGQIGGRFALEYAPDGEWCGKYALSYDRSSSSKIFASLRTGVSKPSVNQL